VLGQSDELGVRDDFGPFIAMTPPPIDEERLV
jgi:hypothetical protein